MISKTFITAIAATRKAKPYAADTMLSESRLSRRGRSRRVEDASGTALASSCAPLREPKQSTGAGIVFGTDFSNAANLTANVAARMCKRLKASLTIMHAVHDPVRGGRSEALEAMMGYKKRNKLKAEADRIGKMGIAVQEEFVHGAPATALAGAANRSQARLIVLSSLKKRKLAGSLHEGIAERLTQISPVPVLAIRAGKPFEDWLSGKRALNILVGHDLSPAADAALTWVASLRKVGRCRITVAHFTTSQMANDCLEVRMANGRRSNWEVRELLREALTERCRSILARARFRVEVHPARRSVSGSLCRLATAQEADLIAIGTARKSTFRRILLGSVSHEILRCSSKSVAFVPRSRREDI